MNGSLSARIVLACSLVVAGCSGGVASVASGGGTSSSSGASGASGGTAAPAPTFLGSSAGCGDLSAMRANADGTQYVTVQVDLGAIGMQPGTSRTIDLATAPSSVKVRVEVYAGVPDLQFCSDFGSSAPPASTTWTAEAGTLELQLEARKTAGPTYAATIRIKNLRLVGPERGTSAIVPSVEMNDLIVGWLGG